MLNPLVFCFVLLVGQGFYLWGDPAWYGVALGASFIVSLSALSVPSLRLYALAALLWILFNHAAYFLPSAVSPAECLARPDRLTGVPKSASFSQEEFLSLSQVKVFCQGKQYLYPWARLEKKGLKGWFLAGERIELKGFKASQKGWGLKLKGKKRNYALNLARREMALKRGRVYYQLLAQGQYYLRGTAQELYLALALGHKEGMSPSLKQSVRLLGLSHLFAISGMHIGILFLWIRWLLRRCALLFPHGLASGKFLFLFDFSALLLVYIYIDLLGYPISALRSFEMLSYWVILRHFMPWQPLWMALLFAANLTLLAHPWLVANLSFQLSFLSVTALFFLLPLLPKPGQGRWKRIKAWVGSSLAISGWLFVFTLPVILGIFGPISLWSIPSNPLHIFFLAFAFLPLSLFILALSGVGLLLGGWSWAWLLYAPVQFMGTLWHEVLKKNAELAPWGLLPEIQAWGWGKLALYWIVLCWGMWAWGKGREKKARQAARGGGVPPLPS